MKTEAAMRAKPDIVTTTIVAPIDGTKVLAALNSMPSDQIATLHRKLAILEIVDSVNRHRSLESGNFALVKRILASCGIEVA